jgi:hypothetical protein
MNSPRYCPYIAKRTNKSSLVRAPPSSLEMEPHAIMKPSGLYTSTRNPRINIKDHFERLKTKKVRGRSKKTEQRCKMLSGTTIPENPADMQSALSSAGPKSAQTGLSATYSTVPTIICQSPTSYLPSGLAFCHKTSQVRKGKLAWQAIASRGGPIYLPTKDDLGLNFVILKWEDHK